MFKRFFVLTLQRHQLLNIFFQIWENCYITLKIQFFSVFPVNCHID